MVQNLRWNQNDKKKLKIQKIGKNIKSKLFPLEKSVTPPSPRSTFNPHFNL